MEVLRNQVSVVLQNNVLFSGTILENLRWGDKDASEEECIRACKLACADEFIQRFPDGYNTYIEQAEVTYPVKVRNSVCVLQEHCLSRRF